MNGKNFLLLFSPIITVFFLSGCATIEEEPENEPEKTPIIQQELPEIQEARLLMAFGSPKSITEGYELLRSAPAGNSAAGQELLFIGKNLMALIYPELPFEPGVSVKPVDSEYPEIFENVQSGEFSILLENWDSPLKLSTVACAALFSSDESVLILCGTAAQAALAAMRGLDSAALPLYILGVIEEKRGHPARALESYEQAARLDLSMYPVKWNAVQIYRELERDADAVPFLISLTEQFPENIDYAMALCSIFTETGEIEAAENILNGIEISEKHGRYDEFLFLKSSVLEKAGDLEGAVAAVEILQQRSPEDTAVLKRYGMLSIQQGKIQKGITVLELAVEKGCIDWDIRKELISFYTKEGKWEEAKGVLDDIFGEIEDSDVLTDAVQVYIHAADFESAEKLSLRLVAKAPENPDFLTGRAEILLLLQDFEEAAEVIHQALAVSGSRQQRSVLFVMLSDTVPDADAKIEVLQSALFENMENLDALVQIATLYKKLGEYRKATRYIRQASALAPDNKKVSELADELGGLIGQ